jgi:hypothetical protein
VAGSIGSIENFIDLIGTQAPDLPACSLVPQAAMLSRAPYFKSTGGFNMVMFQRAGT